MVFVKKRPFLWTKLSHWMSRFWELYYSAPMTLRSLKFIPSIDMTFLSKVLDFLILASNGFWVMNAFVKKVIFAYGIFWKILLMALAPGLIAIFHFSFQFPLYFLKIYNFELINCFRFRLPYTRSGNPFGLCKNIWAYSVEGIWKFNLFFVGKVGNRWGLALCNLLGNSWAWFFFYIIFLIFDFGFFWAFSC